MRKLFISMCIFTLFNIMHLTGFAQPYRSPSGVNAGLFAWYDGSTFDNTTRKWNPRFGSTTLEAFSTSANPNLYSTIDYQAGYQKTVKMKSVGVRAQLLPNNATASYTVFAVSSRYGFTIPSVPYKPVTWGFGGKSAYPGFFQGNGSEPHEFHNSMSRTENFIPVNPQVPGWTISSLNFAYGYDQRNDPKIAAINGEFKQIDAGGVLPADNGWAYLGSNAAFPPGSGAGEDHHFAEFIVYNRKLTQTERHRVHTYLSFKYSIPLLIDPTIGSRITLDGVTDLWDTAKGFNHHVVGIGRSTSASLDARVGTGQFMGDLVVRTVDPLNIPVSTNESFLLIGDRGTYHDYANDGNTMSIPGGKRLKRIWRAQNHGVSDSIMLATASGTVPGGAQSLDPCAPARMLISQDSTFETYTAHKLTPAILYGTTTPPLFSSYQIKIKMPQGESYVTYALLNSPGTPVPGTENQESTQYDSCADDAGFHYFLDATKRPMFAVKGLSVADLQLFKLKIGLRMLSQPLTISNGSAQSTMMKRLLSINTTGTSFNKKATIRFYYRPEEKAESELAGGTGFWFKKEASADQTITDFSADGQLESGTYTVLPGTEGTQNGTAYVEFKDLESFSTLGYMSVSSALPVKLISFNAENEKQITRLFWQTSSELNASHFEVQRSVDASKWQTIADIAATGTTQNTIKYSYDDDDVPAGKSYYRLKMYDLDGSVSFSRVLSISSEKSPDLTIFPNPSFTKEIRIQYHSAAQIDIKDISFVDQNGVRVLRLQKNLSANLDISKLTHGQYTVRITLKNGESLTRKLVVGH
jgi:hypothetical protein